jgi:preprotein translocase subunit SecE
MSNLEIYKRGQGKYVRVGTFIGVVATGLIGAVFLSDKIGAWADRNAYLMFGVPTLLVAVLAAVMYWVLNRPNVADFMIATESEMKKVSWSSRKEVIGSTKVVIVTTFILAVLLFGVDFLFGLIFHVLGILG